MKGKRKKLSRAARAIERKSALFAFSFFAAERTKDNGKGKPPGNSNYRSTIKRFQDMGGTLSHEEISPIFDKEGNETINKVTEYWRIPCKGEQTLADLQRIGRAMAIPVFTSHLRAGAKADMVISGYVKPIAVGSGKEVNLISRRAVEQRAKFREIERSEWFQTHELLQAVKQQYFALTGSKDYPMTYEDVSALIFKESGFTIEQNGLRESLLSYAQFMVNKNFHNKPILSVWERLRDMLLDPNKKSYDMTTKRMEKVNPGALPNVIISTLPSPKRKIILPEYNQTSPPDNSIHYKEFILETKYHGEVKCNAHTTEEEKAAFFQWDAQGMYPIHDQWCLSFGEYI